MTLPTTFDEVYRKYHKPLASKARRLIPNADPHEALQLVSDVFLDLDADLKRGVVIDHIRGYLFRKLHGKSLDWFRRTFSRRRIKLEEELPDELRKELREELGEELREESNEESGEGLSKGSQTTKGRFRGPRQSPEFHQEYLMDKKLGPEDLTMLREQLSLALSRLPAIEREAVLLHHVQGNTYQECAILQEVPVSTFEKRMISATRKLRRTLSLYQRGTVPCSEPNPSMTSLSPQMTATN